MLVTNVRLIRARLMNFSQFFIQFIALLEMPLHNCGYQQNLNTFYILVISIGELNYDRVTGKHALTSSRC